MKLNAYAKAIIAAFVSGLGALSVAASDDVLTSGDWVAVASATVAALALVWGVPNAPERP